MIKENSKKTSVNVPIGLVNVYDNVGKKMKKDVLTIRPSDFSDTTLRKLFKKYKITIQKGTKNLWQNKKFFDELFTLLFPNPSDRTETARISLDLRTSVEKNILFLAGETKLTSAFCKLLLLYYALCQQNNMKQVKENTVNYYNRHILKLPEDSIHTNSCYDIKSPLKPKITSDTGLKVHGNKKWFLNNFREILQALPNSVDTFVEPSAGSGTIALETCNHRRFQRIITNDIYWHKANYLRAFF